MYGEFANMTLTTEGAMATMSKYKAEAGMGCMADVQCDDVSDLRCIKLVNMTDSKDIRYSICGNKILCGLKDQLVPTLDEPEGHYNIECGAFNALSLTVAAVTALYLSM